MKQAIFQKGLMLMHSFFSIAVELSVGLFALIILTKVMGRASLSESTPFDFISMIVVGDFVSDAIYDPETHIFKVIFAILFWGILIYIIDIVTLKFHQSRGFFESQPALVINKGKIDRNVMKKNRVDMNHLQMLLRDRDIFSFREIEFAILEPNGKVSVIRKPEYETTKRGDLDLANRSISVPVTLISDGVIINRNLDRLGKTEQWLISELKKHSIEDPKKVMIAEWRNEDGLFVQKIL
ncbi:DUF421 domain-containing protein [Sporolactobacillus laevolacticus]|uniref:DUF421 domain-containing protein n=1 Tax=Sporolactobacillus laevolacticus TaxID=33018 RepID=UPI0025B4D565|nr:DUF421 domain-containing protein [Sporolactobacillus laevolacticus]MDN3954173.1 DUF421 domain-containing protein [Sporolactobacillus laevolacticus]